MIFGRRKKETTQTPTRTLVQRNTLVGHQPGQNWRGVEAIAWSPDSRRLATAGLDGTARIWDAGTGEQQFVCAVRPEGAWSVAWSPDGKRLATGSRNRTAQVWDCTSGTLIYDLDASTRAAELDVLPDRVCAASWSPSGDLIATDVADEDGIMLWNSQTGELAYRFAGAGSNWRHAWSPDGRYIALGGGDRQTPILDVAAGELRTTLVKKSPGTPTYVSLLAWSPEGGHLAVHPSNYIGVEVWSFPSMAFAYFVVQDPPTGPRERVEALQWSSDGTRLATVGQSKLFIWNLVDGPAKGFTGERNDYAAQSDFDPELVIGLHRSDDIELHWLPGATVVAASGQHGVTFWSATTGVNQGHIAGGVDATCISPDGAHIALSRRDGTVEVWSVDGRTA